MSNTDESLAGGISLGKFDVKWMVGFYDPAVVICTVTFTFEAHDLQGRG